MKKILTIVSNLEKGGTQRVAQIYTESYLKLGHQARILVTEKLGGDRYEMLRKKVEIHSCEENGIIKDFHSWYPDLIHIHSNGVKYSKISELLQHLKGKSKIVETNVFSIPSPWEHYLDYSFQLSKWAEWLYILRGGDRNKSIILPNAVDTEAFSKAKDSEITKFKTSYDIPNDAFVLGRIGQSLRSKWSPMLIDVFEKFTKQYDKNSYLLLVNPPQYILERGLASEFAHKIIHIPKIIGDKNLSIAYSAMDVMVHIAEQGESFGLVLAESILCGTPVAALNTPWDDNSQGEVVGHNIGGLLAHNEKGLLKAIKTIYNVGKDNFMNTAANNHITSNFDAMKLARKSM